MAVTSTGADPKIHVLAGFWSDSSTYDPLFASDVISQSAGIASGQGILRRGQVLLGPVHTLPILAATNLTITPGAGLESRAILAHDIDTTGGNVTGLIYTQGNFLDTALTFTSQGGLLDSAQLNLFDIHILTVEQRSGKLVPMTGLPAGAGPMPQSKEEEEEAAKEPRRKAEPEPAHKLGKG